MSKPTYLKRDEFDLQKIKIEKDSLKVEFTEVRQGNEGLVKIPHSMEPPFVVHPDLLEVLSKMKTYVAMQYGYHLLSNEENEKEYKEMLQSITVYGLSVSGSEQLKGAIINGKIKTESGTRALPSGRIVYSSEKLGYEQEVQQLVELVEIEVYECLFNNKRSQLDLFDQDGVKQHPAKKKGELVSEAV